MNPDVSNEEDGGDDDFRCVRRGGGWVFEVAVVGWESPHEPGLTWKVFRTWKREPGGERLRAAKAAAIKRYYRTCTHCQELCQLGHMHDRTTCQGCAERLLGVVH